MTSALIVIDMQEGSFTPRGARHDTAGVVARINDLAGRARAAGAPVIFIQQNGPPGDAHHPAAPGWRLLAELDAGPGDRFIGKTACDAFLGTELEALLRAESVERLVITGCATDYCVDTTVRSALARGYSTTVPSDGHTTADRPHLSAERIIEHHNAIWADFMSPAGPAVVRASAEIEFG